MWSVERSERLSLVALATGFGEIIVDVGADGAGSRFAAEGALHRGKDEATFFFGQITIGIELFEV